MGVGVCDKCGEVIECLECKDQYSKSDLNDLLYKIPFDIQEYLRIEGRVQLLESAKNLGVWKNLDLLINQNRQLLEDIRIKIDRV